MATQAIHQLYPLSTDAGQPIPLEIVSPLRCKIIDVVAENITAATLPDDLELTYVWADLDVAIDFGGSSTFPSSGAASGLFVPAGTVLSVDLRNVSTALVITPLRSGEAGKLVIQEVQRWIAIGSPRSLSVR